MKKFQLLLIIIFCGLNTLSAQKAKYEIQWQEEPQTHAISEDYSEEPAVIVSDNRYVQVIIEQGIDPATLYSLHKIIKVNSDAGIEMFNKLYIPVSYGEELTDLKVRTISPEQKVQDFNKDNLKELSNVNGYSNFSIFAIEGIEIGSEIEYMYTVKQQVETVGREIYQRDIPVLNAKFELYYPTRFNFSSKSYNGFPEQESKTPNKIILEAKDIPGLSDEGFSSYKSTLMRVDYKIESNPETNNLITWNSIGENVYNNLNSGTGAKTVSKFIKQLALKKKTEREKIILIEKTFKDGFTFEESSEEKYKDVDFILENKIGSSFGMNRAYIKCFNELELDYQIVLSNNRFLGNLDPDYANGLDLRDIIFYFPKHESFIVPDQFHMRFGPAPSEMEGNTGLYIYNDYGNGANEFKKTKIQEIPILSADNNKMGIKADMSISDEMNEVNVKLENYSMGHRAYTNRFFFKRANEEIIENYKRSFLTSAIEDAEFVNYSLKNDAVDLNTDKNSTFSILSEFNSKSMIQKAGRDLLFPIGKVIGKQVEMYEEKNRVSDVYLDQIKRYTHTLKLDVPKGYKVTGLDQLQINNVVDRDGEVIMRFVSDYEYKGNELVVTIHEDYDVLQLDKSYYNEYRRVINSAADFNKVVLVLVPEG